MQFRDLRDSMAGLERTGEVVRVRHPVDPYLEMAAICDRTLRRGGPALLFEQPRGHDMPVLGNLFGTATRVARGRGAKDAEALRETGRLLAFLKTPDPRRGHARGLEEPGGVQEGARHGAENGGQRAVLGARARGRRRRPGEPARADLLARRCRAADHPGAS